MSEFKTNQTLMEQLVSVGMGLTPEQSSIAIPYEDMLSFIQMENEKSNNALPENLDQIQSEIVHWFNCEVKNG